MSDNKKRIQSLAREAALLPQEEMLQISERTSELVIGIPKEESFQEKRVALVRSRRPARGARPPGARRIGCRRASPLPGFRLQRVGRPHRLRSPAGVPNRNGHQSGASNLGRGGLDGHAPNPHQRVAMDRPVRRRARGAGQKENHGDCLGFPPKRKRNFPVGARHGRDCRQHLRAHRRRAARGTRRQGDLVWWRFRCAADRSGHHRCWHRGRIRGTGGHWPRCYGQGV